MVRHRSLALAELLAVVVHQSSAIPSVSHVQCAPTYVDDSAAISTDPVGEKKRMCEDL